jgi:hypothetical protein
MSEATAKYWAARCRRGTPPGRGSPCAALLWAMDEVERLRAIKQRALDVQFMRGGFAHASQAQIDAARHILGEDR